ncbi:MAG TPA: Na+/H+ antiporter NhaC [Candidatus Hydrogenedentes bacterium]|nr:Na+/H+ antiporter NhaC [Candidatus Hydrogenedentota bacterium]
MSESTEQNGPGLFLALTPCIVLLALIGVNVYLFGDEASAGPNQMALLLSGVFVALLGRGVLKIKYRDIESRAIKSIVLAMEAVLILMVVGCLIGLWILSGIVPAMIYYGIRVLTPNVFLPVACIVCSIVSLAVGSSWSTMGTVGIALLGIGRALGFPDPLVAGAIISGAYFGDKMSPLSDTTNLAPGIAGSELFTHIRHMFYTTLPSYAITLVLFGGISLFYTPGDFSDASVSTILAGIESSFSVRWYLLLVPALVIVMAARGTPAIPALLTGALLGAATALIFQPMQFINEQGNLMAWHERYVLLIMTAYEGFSLESGHEVVDALLSRGGLAGMYDTIALIMTAMLFGGAMEATGMMPRIARAILVWVRGKGSLVGATVITSILFNIFVAEQYLAIVLTGRMYRGAFRKYKLDARNLSRALEDGGTLTSVLVPWNTCGAFAASVLGVATFAYLPFCFFNLVSPIVAIVMAGLHIGIKALSVDAEEMQEG